MRKSWRDRGSFVDRMMRRIAPESWKSRSISKLIAAELTKLGQDGGVDLLEMEETFGWAGAVAKQINAPVVIRLHGPWAVVGPALGVTQDNCFASRVRAEGSALRAAAAISAPSQDVLNRVIRLYGLKPRHAAVIPNPAPIYPPECRWSPDACHRNTILFVGRFDRCKGGDLIIEAMAEVVRQHPGSRLLFVGPDSGLRDGKGRRWTLKEYSTKQLGAAAGDRIHFMGVRSPEEIRELRRKASVTVLCSRYENFPMAGLEAMSMGCPIVATAVGGQREMIQHGRNGLLCPAEAPHELASGILSLLRDSAMAARLGRQAAADCEMRYHPDIVAATMLSFYLDVISKDCCR